MTLGGRTKTRLVKGSVMLFIIICEETDGPILKRPTSHARALGIASIFLTQCLTYHIKFRFRILNLK